MTSFLIGWDVGGWNCDKGKSRDAVLILDSELHIVGTSWRGNLQKHIHDKATTADWIRALFSLCAANPPDQPFHVTMAIDTPLGFSTAFVSLVSRRVWEAPGNKSWSSAQNPYLYRKTECLLVRPSSRPLSAVKDMIGSQATKGMHVLAKFAPTIQSCGVWTDGSVLTAIEAYPSACRGSERLKILLSDRQPLEDTDRQDALICAVVAYLFAAEREALESPSADVPCSEGWIWYPKDC